MLRFCNRFSFSHPLPLRINGFLFHVKTLDRLVALLLWKFNLIESVELAYLSKVIKPGMTVLDVGANLGLYTVNFSKLMGNSGKVYAFEPETENFELLRMNVEKNNLHNVSILQKAVSNKSGVSKLFICEEHRGDHSLFDFEGDRKSMSIDVISLDDFIPAKQKVDVVKIDIQGAELLCLEGMRRIIAENPEIKILCEFLPYDENKEMNSSAIDRTLTKLNLTAKKINPHSYELEPISVLSLFQNKSNYFNLLLEPNPLKG